MARYQELYSRAFYYDVALNRDVKEQIDFVIDAYCHYVGRPPVSLLDIACGPGYHANEAARRQLQAYGLDLMPEMLHLASQYANKEGLTTQWIQADMRDFQLAQAVDVAICMFDGIDVLLDVDDIIHHLQVVASQLTDGGLYIIDCTHPRDSSLSHYGTYTYTGIRDGIHVDIRWATNSPIFHPVTGVAEVTIEIQISENGHQTILTDHAYERLLPPTEIALLARLSKAFDVVGWYGDYNLNQPLDTSLNSYRAIAILQKRIHYD